MVMAAKKQESQVPKATIKSWLEASQASQASRATIKKKNQKRGKYRVPSLYPRRSNQALRPGPPPKPLSN